MAKAAKIERTQKLFLKAMKEKFGADPQAMSTIYERKGERQSSRHATYGRRRQRSTL